MPCLLLPWGASHFPFSSSYMGKHNRLTLIQPITATIRHPDDIQHHQIDYNRLERLYLRYSSFKPFFQA